MKRTLCIALILLLLTACSVPFTSGTTYTAEALPEGVWLYDGLQIEKCDRVYGYDYLTKGGQKAFDLIYGEYFSQGVMHGLEGTKSFKLAEPITYDEYKRVLSLYEAATMHYSRPPKSYLKCRTISQTGRSAVLLQIILRRISSILPRSGRRDISQMKAL